VFLPKGTPPEIVQRLHAGLAETMNSPEVQGLQKLLTGAFLTANRFHETGCYSGTKQ
jgi:tripartite-type tricarboxylate transporter receptor subunit TctC